VIKTGIGYVAAVEVQCPDCFEFIAGENGSHLLGPDSGRTAGQVVECDGCGAQVRMPTVLAKVASGVRAHR
jgi:ribosomal protein S27E